MEKTIFIIVLLLLCIATSIRAAKRHHRTKLAPKVAKHHSSSLSSKYSQNRPASGGCSDFLQSSSRSNYIIEYDYLDRYYQNFTNRVHEEETGSDDDITINVQLTFSRRHTMKPFLRHWTGPIVFVLYATQDEAEQLVQLLMPKLVRRNVSKYV